MLKFTKIIDENIIFEKNMKYDWIIKNKRIFKHNKEQNSKYSTVLDFNNDRYW